MPKVKSGNLAKRLEVSPATIRSWADEYSDHLSAQAAPDATGAARKFDDRDQVIMATVADGRNQGLNHEQIHELLNAGKTVEELPELPTEEEEQARADIELVPMTELKRALDLARTYEIERDRLQAERDEAKAETSRIRDEAKAETSRIRDEALAEANRLRDEIARLERETGRLEGRQPVTFWLGIMAVVFVVVVLLAVAVIWYAGAVST
jgi:DNA-binding transcriptional MerR regulator